jgi:hypothetical protein
MQSIILITPEPIKQKFIENFDPQSIRIGTVNNRQISARAQEHKAADLLFLENRYYIATEYMSWFLPCWHQLEENQQRILQEMYMVEKQRTGALVRLQRELSYSESQIGRLKKKAVNNLAFLLYGK